MVAGADLCARQAQALAQVMLVSNTHLWRHARQLVRENEGKYLLQEGRYRRLLPGKAGEEV